MSNLLIEWEYVSKEKDGEVLSGDCYNFQESITAYFIFIIDGLGHGEDASKTSKMVVNYLDSYNFVNFTTFSVLFESIHALLHGERGVVMSAAYVNKESHVLEWAGVGNVNGILISSDSNNQVNSTYFINQEGIIGFNLPNIISKKINLTGQEILIIQTDGIEDLFGNLKDIEFLLNNHSLKQVSIILFDKFRKSSDDGLLWLGKFTIRSNVI